MKGLADILGDTVYIYKLDDNGTRKAIAVLTALVDAGTKYNVTYKPVPVSTTKEENMFLNLTVTINSKIIYSIFAHQITEICK